MSGLWLQFVGSDVGNIRRPDMDQPDGVIGLGSDFRESILDSNGLQKPHSPSNIAGKYLKCFGGPGEIRTHDLFHAI